MIPWQELRWILIFAVGSSALLVVSLLLGPRRQVKRLIDSMRESATRDGEGILLGPEGAVYRERGWGWGIQAPGVAIITDRQVAFASAVHSGAVEFPKELIVSISRSNRPLMAIISGMPHIWLGLRDGSKVCFLTKRPDAWVEAVDQLLIERE